MSRTLLQFPWFAVLVCVAFIFLLILESEPGLAADPAASLLFWLRDFEHKMIMLTLVLGVLVFDIVRFRRAGRAYDTRIKSLKEQVDELFKSKSALQNKAHKYSGHADKLKLFISDRLLEYIEYDEKFLHFKSIASEVRHNGVICFDQVGSLLRQRLSQELPPQDRQQYQDALDSMVYLWDLLDLSTTDNIAMYVANKLYECEELYYHQLLDKVEQGISLAPVFPAHRAALTALRALVEDGNRIATADLDAGESFGYEDDQFLVRLEAVGDLLGNENYVRLIIENMLNNGLYYAAQKQYRNRYARVSLRLSRHKGDAVFVVYNPGPHIAADVREKIYQLGYSTKRSSGNQGKGLGLYFVKQLVNGYEGSIDFTNVCNLQDSYVIRIECQSGAVINRIIETAVNDRGRPLCRTDSGELLKEQKFRVEERIRSLEVSRQGKDGTHIFREFGSGTKTSIMDPSYRERPAWTVDVVMRRSSTEVAFRPLDVMGVEFTIHIPTAASRLDPEYHETTQQTLSEPVAVHEQVRAVGALIQD